jgi:prepilin-type N-terminal cleavage/methylation domain-containing protein/prepilin-type processing-associated H-X9-DG protein
MSKQSQQKVRAFTLIELLVVIGIIAILAAILFPVFGRARENARRSTCLSNMKQILLASTQYTQDSDELYPPSYTNISGKWVGFTQLYQPYLKSTQLFQCPSDSKTDRPALIDWTPAAGTGFVPSFHTSYLVNDKLGKPSAPVALSVVVSPSTVIYMAEGSKRATSSASGTDCSGLAYGGRPYIGDDSLEKPDGFLLVDPWPGSNACNSTVNGFAGPSVRHLGQSVVGFADGHVKSMPYTSWYYHSTPWLNPGVGGG